MASSQRGASPPPCCGRASCLLFLVLLRIFVGPPSLELVSPVLKSLVKTFSIDLLLTPLLQKKRNSGGLVLRVARVPWSPALWQLSAFLVQVFLVDQMGRGLGTVSETTLAPLAGVFQTAGKLSSIAPGRTLHLLARMFLVAGTDWNTV